MFVHVYDLVVAGGLISTHAAHDFVLICLLSRLSHSKQQGSIRTEILLKTEQDVSPEGLYNSY